MIIMFLNELIISMGLFSPTNLLVQAFTLLLPLIVFDLFRERRSVRAAVVVYKEKPKCVFSVWELFEAEDATTKALKDEVARDLKVVNQLSQSDFCFIDLGVSAGAQL